jgi:hypothetical protein
MDPNFFVAKKKGPASLPGRLVSLTERFTGNYPSMLSPFHFEGMSILGNK